MFEEAIRQPARWFLSENALRRASFDNIERLARAIGCIPFLQRDSLSRPGRVSRGYRRALLKNVMRACCKPKERWEVRI